MDAQLKPNSKQALEQLQRDVENVLAPLGYEVVAMEQSTAGGRKITLFIDFLNNSETKRRIGLDDCVAVNKAVDELFETTPLVEGHYTLEVSSPGVERPLRKAKDFDRFRGRKARLHTFRALEKEETENLEYWEKHKKQKNFIGRLEGLNGDGEKVKLSVDGQFINVPLALISKAHLEFEGVIET
ncbi:MAG: ribosome maturation factor RimP [Bdellovibrionota bacterium]